MQEAAPVRPLSALVIAAAPEVRAPLAARLERHLHATVVVAASPARALEARQEDAFDVVVADMDTLGREPARPLAHLQRMFATSTRVLLAARADWERALEAVPFVHQFLTKPLDPQQLDALARRVGAMGGFMLPLPLRRMLGSLPALPTAPSVVGALGLRLEQSGVRSPDLATVVRRDAGLTCRVLQLANAGLFESASRLCDVDGAIALLGPSFLLRLLDAGALCSSAPPHLLVDLERVCRHALVVATVAKSSFRDPRAAEAAFSAGLLHVVGWLALAVAAPDVLAERARKTQTPQQHDGFLERVTGYVLQTWGLPDPLVAATVECHREPDEETFSPASAVYLARKLAALVATSRCGPITPEAPLTNRFVQRHRLAKELPGMVDRRPAPWTRLAEPSRRCRSPLEESEAPVARPARR